MKFGLLYEMQIPRPWGKDTELTAFQQALEEVKLADALGYDYIWANEHHFTEEYSHSSAPEVFLGACATITKQIQLGHAVALTLPGYTPPARVAERIATLDLVSNGRVAFGSGESASRAELEGFNVDPSQKRAMWTEATEQICHMMAMEPYPGFEGTYFSMPCRNVVPKPVQKPHPPLWLACSKRETIHMAARLGMGALTFAFVSPEEAKTWRDEYYDIIKSDQCVPLGYTVNANIAMVTGFALADDEAEAKRRGSEGLGFFGYSLGHYYIYGEHVPGRTDVYARYQKARENEPYDAPSSGIGTAEQVAEKLKAYDDMGIDQMIFLQRCGKMEHDHILESMRRFAEEVMPDFKAREAIRQKVKQEELAPYIAAALARKKPMPAMKDDEIPPIIAFGKAIAAGAVVGGGQQTVLRRDEAGGVIMTPIDPAAQ